jgi:hypothetical protein
MYENGSFTVEYLPFPPGRAALYNHHVKHGEDIPLIRGTTLRLIKKAKQRKFLGIPVEVIKKQAA